MKNMKYVSEIYCNLFNISTVLKEDYYLEGGLKMMKIPKTVKEHMFDR